jgi:heme exporter protein A
LYDDLTAAENLAFAATMLGLSGTAADHAVADALGTVGLADGATNRVRSFSAGMRRRLALGRILLARPSLVLLDEPFSALDPAGMRLIEQLLAGWRRDGVTALVASHATEHMDGHADATVRLEGGLVAAVAGEGVVSRPFAAGPAGIPALDGAR